MKYCVIATLILTLVRSLMGWDAETNTLVESEKQCDAFCFKLVKPMVDHIRVNQKFWMACNATDIEFRLDQIERQMATQLEKAATYETAIREHKEYLMEQSIQMHERQNKHQTSIKQIGSKYYYIEQTQNISWYAAAEKCHALGAHLISIANQAELDAIIPHLDESQRYSIDIADLDTNRFFYSLTSGVSAPFLSWRPGEPNNLSGHEHCVELKGPKFNMNDIPCLDEKKFICEFSDDE